MMSIEEPPSDHGVRIRITPALDADVIIVGAGPAGSAAAIHLTRAGWHVLLLERHSFPRDKVCGDFVGPVALVELRQLGIEDRLEYRASHAIWSAALHVDGQELIARPLPMHEGLPNYGRCIPRLALDAWLLDAARRTGATILEGVTVLGYHTGPDAATLRTKCGSDERTFRAQLIIGADGSSSTISRQLRGAPPPNSSRIIAVRAYYESCSGPPDRADLYFSGESFPGYYWLFPTSERTANVGVGMVLETYPPKDDHLRDMMLQLVAQDPALRKRLGEARILGKIVGWPLSTYDPSLALIGERVLLIGDAAGFINPLNGEGIQYALLSARWAAECGANALRCGDFSEGTLMTYAERVERELRFDMAFAGMIVECIRNRHLNLLWLKVLSAIVARARVDSRYADVCGSVLAGLVPCNRALSVHVIGRTIDQILYSNVLATGWSVLQGPRQIVTDASEVLSIIGNIVAALGADPRSVVKWASAITRQGGALAIETVVDALGLRAAREGARNGNVGVVRVRLQR